MKKILIAVTVVLIIGIFGAWWFTFSSPYGAWSPKEKGNFDIFSGELTYMEVETGGEEKSEIVKVFHDNQRVGMFCSEIEQNGDVLVCVPFIMGKEGFDEGEKLNEVMEVPLLGGAMATKVDIKNGLFAQTMQISVYPLSAPCAKDKNCEWKRMTLYKRGL